MPRRRTVLGELAATVGAAGLAGCQRLLHRGPPDPEILAVNREEAFVTFENHGGPGTVHLFVTYSFPGGGLFDEKYLEVTVEAGEKTRLFTGTLQYYPCDTDFEVAMYGEPLDGTPDPVDVQPTVHQCGDRYYALLRFRNDGPGGRVKANVWTDERGRDFLHVFPVRPRARSVRTLMTGDRPTGVDGWVRPASGDG